MYCNRLGGGGGRRRSKTDLTINFYRNFSTIMLIECQILAAISQQNIRIGASNMDRSLKMTVKRDVSNTIVIGP